MTFLRVLDNLARLDSGAIAVIEPQDEGVVEITRGQFVERVLLTRHELADRGFAGGDCLAIWLPNWSAALVWQLAAGSLGGHVIGINTRYGVQEVSHVLTLARPKIVVLAHDFVGLDLIGRLREAVLEAASDSGAQAPQVVPLAEPGSGPVGDLAAYDVGGGAWLPGATEPLTLDDHAQPTGDDLYVAFTTSGSTGMPKLAAHKENATLDQCLAAARGTGMGEGKLLIAALPFSGTFGFTAAFAMLLTGGRLIMHPSFKPTEIVRLVEEFGVTHLAFGDDMMTRVIESSDDANLSSLEWAGIADFQGAARVSAEWLEANAGAHVSGLYGSSDTFALLTTSPSDIPAPDRWLPGGRLNADALHYRIADDDGVITDGSEGEIQFRGPQTVDAYLGQPQKMAENHTSDGWFSTGDLGRALDERSFRYVCRAAEALRLKGFLVEPDEIGNHLATHPAVDIAKVVGVRRDAGDEAVGFVTLAKDAHVTGDDLIAHCAKSLARYKIPVAVYVIDEMPVTAGTNGTKIRANVLKEWALERLS